MAVKKSDLYAHLWQSCDALRGGMDASQYKDYVLVLLFLKYVSDRAGAQDSLLEVPPDASFSALVALKNNKNIGEGINTVLAQLAEVNDLRGVIDVADFNDEDKLGRGQDMVDRLTKLVAIFENPALDFSGNRADGDDLLGDAYEYLMRHFATESGKSKGQFYTPAEVSRVLASVIGIDRATSPAQTVHDPACGSGSLLLKVLDVAKDTTGLELTAYGQEMDNATAALARMNMFIHGAGTAEIWNDNTLSRPHFLDGPGQLKRHDWLVANPPFSLKAWTNGVNTGADPYGRFEYGVPPAKNGDYAFLLHILAALKSTGTAGVILPHGVLFRGNAEADIRRELVKRGYIKTIIGLPANLFYGTGIPACIIVLDKSEADTRDSILMVDASRGFAKDGAKNRLRERDIHKIIDTVRAAQDVPGYARSVPITEIASAQNDYNLNLSRYIDSAEVEDLHDLEAHLRGGIPERDVDLLGSFWAAFPALREQLFAPSDRPGYLQLRVPADDVEALVQASEELAMVRADVVAHFEGWWDATRPQLTEIGPGTRPKALVTDLTEGLLDTFRSVDLVDEYAIYQTAREYWAEVMADDVYLVADSGWAVGAKPTKILAKSSQRVDFTIGKDKFGSELLPARLLIDAFLPGEQAEVDSSLADLDRIDAELTEMLEEHGTDEGLLADAVGDKGSFTKAAIALRRDQLRQFHAESVAAGELTDVTEARARLDEIVEQMNTLASEQSGPGLPLDGLTNKNGTLAKGKVTQRAKELAGKSDDYAVVAEAASLLDDADAAKKALKKAETALEAALAAAGPPVDEFSDEREMLDACEQLLDARASAAAAAKTSVENLQLVLARTYDELDDEVIPDLVIDAKWKAAFAAGVTLEIDRLAFLLAARVAELARRYEDTLPNLVERSATLEERVEAHLERMGFKWR